MYCFGDGPGQGGMLYEQRVPMRPDFETVLTPVIDWVSKQPGVDAQRLAVVGRSFAGYLAPRAAAFEKRLAALVCDPGQVEFVSRIVPKMFDEATWQRVLAGDAALDKKLGRLARQSTKARMVWGLAWRPWAQKPRGIFCASNPPIPSSPLRTKSNAQLSLPTARAILPHRARSFSISLNVKRNSCVSRRLKVQAGIAAGLVKPFGKRPSLTGSTTNLVFGETSHKILRHPTHD